MARMNKPRRPELLSPAGSLKALRFACAYGADAVYAGLPRYSLRVRKNTFRNAAALAEGIATAHTAGKQFFLAVNLVPHDRKVRTFIDDMAPILDNAQKPDALIMADPGLIMLVRERWPEMPVHLSVQASTMNSSSVRFWQKLGLRRIILSRELSLDEISEIRQACPDMELEVFVHGALCIAHSGRCLLSGYFSSRDSNQGACTNSCRWKYGIAPAPSAEARPQDAFTPDPAYHPHPLAQQPWLIDETARRAGEYMEIFEDENGAYIMNSRDLRAIEHVRRLVEIGVDSLKIEGRTKSHYYAARTAQLYKRAIDDAVAGRPFDPALLAKLDGLANRGYTDGFLGRHEARETQNYERGESRTDTQEFVAEVTAYDAATGYSTLDVKNRFAVGDRLEIISPDGDRDMTLGALENTEGQPVETAPGNGHTVRAKLGETLPGLTLVARYLQTAREARPQPGPAGS
ncbi:putative protease [Ereboglobus sp. PH5-5]|nr:putative protease [Ereboglobus sp. PH5-5]